MKLHLKNKTSFSSVTPKIPLLRYNDFIFYYSNSTLKMIHYASNKIIKSLHIEGLNLMKTHQNQLYLCSNDVLIVNINSFEIVYTLKLSKAAINNIEFYNHKIIVSKINNRISVFESLELIYDFYSQSLPLFLFIDDMLFGFVDQDSICIMQNNQKILETKIENVLALYSYDGGVFTINSSGLLKNWSASNEYLLKPNLCTAKFSEDKIICCSENIIYEFSIRGELSKESTIEECLQKYYEYLSSAEPETYELYNDLGNKKIKLEDEKTKNSSDSSNSQNIEDLMNSQKNLDYEDLKDSDSVHIPIESMPFIQYIDENVIRTINDDYFFHSDLFIEKIVCFNSDFADASKFEQFILIGSSSGDIKYLNTSKYDEGEFLFDGLIFKAHDEGITSFSLFKDFILTGSSDNSAKLWKIEKINDNLLDFCLFHVFASSLESITYCSFFNNIFAIASIDNILQIFHSTQDYKDFKNISTQKLHIKQINHVSITSKFIITSSSDKSSKILDHNGALIKTIESDKLLHTSFNDNYIAFCSQKAIKILDSCLNVHCVIQSRLPVLGSCFYNNYLITSTDSIKIFDLKKKIFVQRYDLGLVNSWFIDFPFLCAQNKIIIFEDASESIHNELLKEIRQKKEDSLLLSKYKREHRYREALEVLIRTGDYQKMYKTVCEGYFYYKNLDFMDVFAKCRGKMLEMLIKNPGFKNSEVFNRLVAKEVRVSSDPSRKDKLLPIISKHFENIDNIFIELSSLDIFEENI